MARSDAPSHARALPGDTWLLNWGRFVLGSALSLGLLVTVYVTALAPDLAPFIPILLLAGISGWWLFQHPLANLFVVLCSFIVIAHHEDGIQATEVLYAMYFLGFLGHWFLVHLLLGKEHVIRNREEQMLVLFLVLITLSFPVTIVFGGPLKGILSEWMGWALFGFYFPIRDAIERYRHGLKVVVGAIAFVGLFIFVRNLLNFQEIILNATQAWQVTRGRAVTNTAMILVPAFFALMYFLYAESWKSRILWAGSFVFFFAGLLLTQSRGYWVAFAFGAGILFLMVPGKYKTRLLVSGLIAASGALAIGFVLFADVLSLILGGMLDRLLSIGSAASSDISLVNRWLESDAVWQQIKANPILGHGMSTPFRFYDITWEYSMNRAFMHNGYLSLLFKFGIWGTALMLGFLVTLGVRGYRAFRTESAPLSCRLSALAVVGCLASFSVSAITSNPFYLNDTLFILAVISGVAGGCHVVARSS